MGTRSAWEAAGGASGSPLARDRAYLVRLLDELADGYLLRVHYAPGGDSASVWPATAAQIVSASDSGDSLMRAGANINLMLNLRPKS